MQIQPELHTEASIYAKPFPKFERPSITGFIGLENLKFARFVQDEKVQYDLNLRMNEAKRKPPDLDVKLTDLLTFLLKNEKRLNFPLPSTLDKSMFFCYRGLMTCIACTPYENRESWKVAVILHKGSIYLCARDTDDKIHRKQHMSEKDKIFTSWGYKFEQYVLSDKPHLEPNPDEPVDEMKEFSLVFTTKLNNHTIVYGAEMDGIRCGKDSKVAPINEEFSPDDIINYLSSKEFIELKTNRHIEHPRQETSFRRFKCKKWWCQSFLAGVETILCGFRNDDGIVEELKVFPVKDLPKKSQKFWNPNVCFNFLDTFFTYVKRCLARKIKYKYGDKSLNNLQSLPIITLLAEWIPGGPVLINESYSYDDDMILPDWFINDYAKMKR